MQVTTKTYWFTVTTAWGKVQIGVESSTKPEAEKIAKRLVNGEMQQYKVEFS